MFAYVVIFYNRNGEILVVNLAYIHCTLQYYNSHFQM